MRRLSIGVLLAGCLAANAAELSIPPVTLGPGGAAAAGIRYAAQGHQVAALQVDLHYDAAILKISAAAGPAATASGKVVGSIDVAPGTKRILLMGFNQSVLADGVAVLLQLSAVSETLGTYDLRMTDAIAVDGNGNLVGVAAIDGIVSVERAVEMQRAFGHVISGGRWKTTLTLVNLSSSPATARLNLWGPDGQPLAVPLTILGGGGAPAETVSSLDCSLEPAALFTVETEAPDLAEPLAGWVELQSSESITGFSVLRARVTPDRDSEAMLALEQRTGSVFVLPYDESGGFQTSITIANQSPNSPADVTLTVRDESGNTISAESMSVPMRGSISFVAKERFPALLDRRGTVEVQNNSGEWIGVLGLRFSPSGSFTSVPVMSKNEPSDPAGVARCGFGSILCGRGLPTRPVGR